MADRSSSRTWSPPLRCSDISCGTEDISKMYRWKGRGCVNHQFATLSIPRKGHIACPLRRPPTFPLQRGFRTMADDLRKDSLSNRVKGTAKELGGKMQHAAGDLTGDESQQIRGKAREIEGKAQRRVGQAQD